MKLLLKRVQSTNQVGKIHFKLWAKIEVDADEKALISRYKFDQSLLIGEYNFSLRRNTTIAALVIGFLIAFIADFFFPINLALLIGLIGGGGFGYWYYNEKRERLYVKDLMHGRDFKCPGIIELTKKEAEISEVTAIFRQVMESAKHWGGTQTEDIPVLTREEARAVILKLF